MRKPEVQPLRTLILGIIDIINPLLLSKRLPRLLSSLVPLDVVKLDKYEQQNVPGSDSKEDLVTSVV